jgi:hypothetical protein
MPDPTQRRPCMPRPPATTTVRPGHLHVPVPRRGAGGVRGQEDGRGWSAHRAPHARAAPAVPSHGAVWHRRWRQGGVDGLQQPRPARHGPVWAGRARRVLVCDQRRHVQHHPGHPLCLARPAGPARVLDAGVPSRWRVVRRRMGLVGRAGGAVVVACQAQWVCSGMPPCTHPATHTHTHTILSPKGLVTRRNTPLTPTRAARASWVRRASSWAPPTSCSPPRSRA